jgi:hypothetical protein
MIGVLIKLIKTIIMLKNILKLEGAQGLSMNEQKSIKGSNAPFCREGFCVVQESPRSKWTCIPC